MRRGILLLHSTIPNRCYCSTKDTYDGAQPSGNALICKSLYYLGHIFDRASWISQSEQMIHQMRKLIIQYPSSFSYWGQCFSWMAADAIELVAIGPKVNNSLKRYYLRFNPTKYLFFQPRKTRIYPALLANIQLIINIIYV